MSDTLNDLIDLQRLGTVEVVDERIEWTHGRTTRTFAGWAITGDWDTNAVRVTVDIAHPSDRSDMLTLAATRQESTRRRRPASL